MTDTLKDYVRRQWERDKAQIEREAIDNYIASPEFSNVLKKALKEANDTDPWTGGTIGGWFDIYTDRVIAALKEQTKGG